MKHLNLTLRGKVENKDKEILEQTNVTKSLEKSNAKGTVIELQSTSTHPPSPRV